MGSVKARRRDNPSDPLPGRGSVAAVNCVHVVRAMRYKLADCNTWQRDELLIPSAFQCIEN